MSKCNPPFNNANYTAPKLNFNINSELDKAQKKPFLDVELQETLKQVKKDSSFDHELQRLLLRDYNNPVSPSQSRPSDVGPGKKQNKAFKKWFGDSKIKDRNGNPIIVYHGSPVRGFTKFQIDKANPNDPDSVFNGFWFTTSSSDARNSGRYPWGRPNNEKAQTRAFYLKIENPIKRRDAEKLHRELQRKGIFLNREEMRKELVKRGYDGVVFQDPLLDFAEVMERDGVYHLEDGRRYVTEDYSFYDHTGKKHSFKDTIVVYDGREEGVRYYSIKEAEASTNGVYVAFNGDQIKSATANTGKYSDKSHIYK